MYKLQGRAAMGGPTVQYKPPVTRARTGVVQNPVHKKSNSSVSLCAQPETIMIVVTCEGAL